MATLAVAQKAQNPTPESRQQQVQHLWGLGLGSARGQQQKRGRGFLMWGKTEIAVGFVLRTEEVV